MSRRAAASTVLVLVLSLVGWSVVVEEASEPAGAGTVAAASTTGEVVQAVAVADTVEVPADLAIVTDARWSVAVTDVETGETLWGDTGTFDTASIVKVDILVAFLLQAQDEGRDLTASELSLATAMITVSDNTATTTLFTAVGGESGLEAVNARLGITGIDVGSNGSWGLTQTTADAQLDLLALAFTDDTPLTATSRDVIASLMGSVVDSQRFGVSAAADDPATTRLKVGYLQRSATGLWDVTSIGHVVSGGRTHLVAVLTDGNATFAGGVDLTGQLAVAAVTAMS